MPEGQQETSDLAISAKIASFRTAPHLGTGHQTDGKTPV
jgi:hypothetical protein